MGQKSSTLAPATNSVANASGQQVVQQDDEFLEERPSKRRKILSNLENSSAPTSAHPNQSITVSSAKFSNRSKNAARPSATFVERLKDPVDFRKALRFDIDQLIPTQGDHSIFEQADSKYDGGQRIKCKCTITLSHVPRSASLDVMENSAESAVDLVRKSQTGEIIISKKEQGSVERRFAFSPIVFSSEEVSVNRKINRQREPDPDGPYTVFDLADKYRVKITLECIGEQDFWPPVSIASSRISRRHYELVLLQSKFPLIISQSKTEYKLPVSVVYGNVREDCSYRMDLRVRWSAPTSLPCRKRKAKKVEVEKEDVIVQSVTTIESEQVKAELSPVKALDTIQEATGETRSTRGKTQKTYNLKVLSAQAQGKSPRTRKRKAFPNMEPGQRKKPCGPELTLCYHRNDPFHAQTTHTRTFYGLTCPFCHTNHRSFELLRFHLQGEHDSFKYHVRSSTVTANRESHILDITKGRPASGMDGRIIQLNRPVIDFDLERFLDGDDSWLKARQGPEHNHWSEYAIAGRFHRRIPDSSGSPSSRPSRYSSPNTTGSLEDEVDGVSRILNNLQIPKPKYKLKVPRTAKPLFHTVTKQLLHAGEELPDSDDEVDEDWFLLKHRDLTNDFSDVTDGEKEYTHRWTPFAMKSELHLPETIIGFVETNKGWLAESAERRKWFTVHMGTLTRRGVVNERFLARMLGVIRKAEQEAKEEVKKVVEPVEQPPKQRGLDECTCFEHVSTIDRVVCMGTDCTHRYFHKQCLTEAGIDFSIPQWRCESCKQVEMGTIFGIDN